jgi:hypothetical protein
VILRTVDSEDRTVDIHGINVRWRWQEDQMLFLVTWEPLDSSEEAQRRVNALFMNWKRPEQANFIGFYSYADRPGGAAVLDVPDHATLARATANFTPYLSFDARPLLSIDEGVGIGMEAMAYWDSVQ